MLKIQHTNFNKNWFWYK